MNVLAIASAVFCTLLAPAVRAATFTVTNANDSGTGSLRQAVADAAASPGADNIIFDDALSGQTIQFQSEIAIADLDGVTIDATPLAARFTLRGKADQGGGFRLFLVGSNARLTLDGLDLTHAGGTVVHGGAVLNTGVLVMRHCQLSSNYASYGGAIYEDLFGQVTLDQCSFFGNGATHGDALAVMNLNATAFLRHCTFNGNNGVRATIINVGSLTLTHCTVSGNAIQVGAALVNAGSMTLNYTIVAGNSINNTSGSFSGTNNITSGDPLLGPFGAYGGSTPTMPVLRNSPALNAAVGSTATNDQRGFPIVAPPDIGAYEAGTTTNYDAWIWETLPASATGAQHASAADFDGDSVTNYNEWLAFTDAADAASYLRPPRATSSGGVFYLSFPTAIGRRYSLEAKTNLSDAGPWQPVAGSTLFGTGSNVTVPIAPFFGIPNYFVRVVVGL